MPKISLSEHEQVRGSSSSERPSSLDSGVLIISAQQTYEGYRDFSRRRKLMIGVILSISACVAVLVAFAARRNSHGPTLGRPIIDLGYAKYQGVRDSEWDVNHYFGLRYAAPPVDHQRWKLPVPIESVAYLSQSTIDASQPASACIQGFPYWRANDGRPRGSEDCLVLNVVQPANATANLKLPVLINIHGGGYTLGNGSWASGLSFMKHTGNAIIYVSIQYRLGVYGFLGSSDFVEQGGIVNVGLVDQRAALLWVQKHISVFGGDRSKVTIIGDSAGGGSVTAQIMWAGGEENPPFRAAIAQYPWWQRYPYEEQLKTQYRYLLDATNCTNLDCIRLLSENDLADASQATYDRGEREGAYGYGTFFYGPSLSGAIIPSTPSRAFATGNFSKVPLLTYHSPWEGYGFTPLNINETGQAIDLLQQFPNAKKGFFQRFYELYPANEFEDTFWQRLTWFGDFMVNCPTQVLASSLVAQEMPVWKLIFNGGTKKHGAASPFLFDEDWAAWERGDARVSARLKDWVMSFVVHGDPNVESWTGEAMNKWPKYGGQGNIMTINDTIIGLSADRWFDDSERCAFWAENHEATQN